MIIDTMTVRVLPKIFDTGMAIALGTKVVSRDKNDLRKSGNVCAKTMATCLAQPHVMMTIAWASPVRSESRVF